MLREKEKGKRREGGREREGEKNSGVRLCVAGTDKRRVLSLACLLLIIWYMCYQLVFIIEDTIERTVRFERLRRWVSENAVFSVRFVVHHRCGIFFFFGKYKMIFFDEMFFFVVFFFL